MRLKTLLALSPFCYAPTKTFELSMLTVEELLTLVHPGIVPGQFLREIYLTCVKTISRNMPRIEYLDYVRIVFKTMPLPS